MLITTEVHYDTDKQQWCIQIQGSLTFLTDSAEEIARELVKVLRTKLQDEINNLNAAKAKFS